MMHSLRPSKLRASETKSFIRSNTLLFNSKVHVKDNLLICARETSTNAMNEVVFNFAPHITNEARLQLRLK